MGLRFVESDQCEKILCIEAISLYDWAMSQSLPYDEIDCDEKVKLENILNNPGDSDIGYFIEVELKYPVAIKQKNKKFFILS